MSFEKPIKHKDVIELTGWSRAKILRLRKEHGFPGPLKCGGYLWSEIEEWQTNQIAKRNEADSIDVEKTRAKYVELKMEMHILAQKLKSANVSVAA